MMLIPRPDGKAHESFEAACEWFRSLTLDERMDLMIKTADEFLAANPDYLDSTLPQPVPGKIAVYTWNLPKPCEK
jgi:hypothetical protein